MSNEIKRLINILIGFGVAIVMLVSGLIYIGSYELAKVNQNFIAINSKIDNIQNQNIDVNALAEQVAVLIPKPKDGTNGTNGVTPPCYFEVNQCRGADGSDSVSKTTIIERELPPQNGKDAPKYQLAQLPTGQLIWKYENDREWSLLPTIELDLEL